MNSKIRGALVNLIVWLAPFLAVVLTLDGPGPTWDEPFYIGASARYMAWFQELPIGSFHGAARDTYWVANHEHPPLTKLAIGLCEMVFAPFVGMVLAGRIVGAVAFATTVLLVYRFTRRHWGEVAGILAGGALILMPRVFGHAHFAALDMPATFMWMATTTVFCRSMTDRRWAVPTGVMFGLSLLTKINAVLLIVALVPWGLILHRRRALPATMAMVVLGPAILILGWPWLWNDTWERLWAFFIRATNRALVPVYYFGKAYKDVPAPWHYPWVMTLVTVPLGLLGAVVCGIQCSIRRKTPARGISMLLLAGIVVQLAALTVPGSKARYDGVRIFLPIFPLLACFAGVGGAVLLDRLRSKVGVGAATVIISIAFASQAVGTLLTHPHELSYYNALVGGVPGANAVGMEVTYWGDSCDREVFEAINQVSPKSSIAMRHIGQYLLPLYQPIGEIPGRYVRPDLKLVGEARDADYLVLVARKGMFDDNDWHMYRHGKPLFVQAAMGVPICLFYEVPRLSD